MYIYFLNWKLPITKALKNPPIGNAAIIIPIIDSSKPFYYAISLKNGVINMYPTLSIIFTVKRI